MKLIKKIIFFQVLLSAFVLKAEAQNLITNPGAESQLPGNGWIQLSGKWQQRLSSDAKEGSAYFYAGNVAFGELYQDVDVKSYSPLIDSGLAYFEYSGFMRSASQFNLDQGKEIVEYRGTNNEIIQYYDSDYKNEYRKWLKLFDARLAPVGTRTIRIRLISKRNSASIGTNDAYHDSLSLTISNIRKLKDRALKFDGTDDYVSLPPQAINNLSQGTIETWVYLNSNDEEIISSKQRDGTNSYSIFSIGSYSSRGGFIEKGISGTVYYHPKNPSGQDPSYINSDILLDTGRWYHIAISFTNSKATLYLNGDKHGDATGDFSIPDDISGNVQARLGYWDGDGQGYLAGKLDQYRVWDIALTQEQIKASMCSNYPARTANLVLSYDMNESDTSSIIHDSSARQLNGALGLNPARPVFVKSDIACPDIKKQQTITFDLIPPKKFGDSSFIVHATASSGLPVTYEVTSGPATLSHDTITILGAEDITIVAKQAGNDEYYPASDSNTIAVIKALQEITFNANLDTLTGETRYILFATSSSHLPVYFKVFSGPGEIKNDSVLTFYGSGQVIVEAYQPGNRNYESDSVHQQFCTIPVPPGTISEFSQTCKG